MLLSEFRSTYLLEHDLSKAHQQNLRFALKVFAEFAGQVELASLGDDLVNRWLVHLADEGYARWTIKNYRGIVLTLWRAAYASGLCEHGPRRIRKIAIPRTLPEAWDLKQLQLLLATAARQTGRFRAIRIPQATYWRAFILTAWDTALRLCDLERICTDQIGDDGTLCMVQAKTAWPVLCRLRPETLAAIAATYPPDRKMVFGGVVTRRHLYGHWTNLVNQAGLSGGTRKLRKSSATWVESVAPGSAQQHLGHKTPGLAWKSYIDPRHLGRDRPLPPAIG